MKYLGKVSERVLGFGVWPLSGFKSMQTVSDNAWLTAQNGSAPDETLVRIYQFNSATTGFTLAGDAAIGTTAANTAIGATRALQLDGTGDAATLATTTLGFGSSTAFSIEVWLRTTVALGGTNVGYVEWVDGTSGDWVLSHEGSSGLTQFVMNSGGLTSLKAATQTLTQNEWDYLAICRTAAGNMSLFLGPVGGTVARVGNTTQTGAIGGSSTGTLRFGASTAVGGNNFTGQIGGFRISRGGTLIDPALTSFAAPYRLFG